MFHPKTIRWRAVCATGRFSEAWSCALDPPSSARLPIVSPYVEFLSPSGVRIYAPKLCCNHAQGKQCRPREMLRAGDGPIVGHYGRRKSHQVQFNLAYIRGALRN
jgi:hypothetical protein